MSFARVQPGKLTLALKGGSQTHVHLSQVSSDAQTNPDEVELKTSSSKDHAKVHQMWDCSVAGLSRNLAPGFYAGPSNSTEVTVELVLELEFPELEWKMWPLSRKDHTRAA